MATIRSLALLSLVGGCLASTLGGVPSEGQNLRHREAMFSHETSQSTKMAYDGHGKIDHVANSKAKAKQQQLEFEEKAKANAIDVAMKESLGSQKSVGDKSGEERKRTKIDQKESLHSAETEPFEGGEGSYDEMENEDEDEEVVVSAQTSAHARPYLTLDKTSYLEKESITVTFTVGSPDDILYETLLLHTALDFDYPNWAVGLFMRDADPQEGNLKPIVRIKLCGEIECDPDNKSFSSYSSSVQFGTQGANSYAMEGKWPLLNSDYGTGFDAYVLDANGAAAIGPIEFNIYDEDSEEYVSSLNSSSASPVLQKSSGPNEPNAVNKNKKLKHGLINYNHASMKKASRHSDGKNSGN